MREGGGGRGVRKREGCNRTGAGCQWVVVVLAVAVAVVWGGRVPRAVAAEVPLSGFELGSPHLKK